MGNGSLYINGNQWGLFSRLIFLTWITGLLFSLAACVAVVPSQEEIDKDLQDKWGIEITGLRLASAGHMVDFRYRVLDAEKAATLFARENKPYLIDQQSQKALSVPNMGKVGPLRTSNKPQEGRIYWMFFGNAGKLIQTGSVVTVVIGDFRAENLIVQ
jgi:hypothetical protein